jgi:hypothetical protein
LLPALSATKGNAKWTACLDNLKQINAGIRMYYDDSNDASSTGYHHFHRIRVAAGKAQSFIYTTEAQWHRDRKSSGKQNHVRRFLPGTNLHTPPASRPAAASEH